MNRFLVYRGLKTPDGTVLHSSHVHDYVTHLDKNGKTYMLDGGLEYARRSNNGDEEIIEVYSNEPYEKVRQYAYRTGYGKPGDSDYDNFRVTFFKDMTNEHLKAAIPYVDKRFGEDSDHLSLLLIEYAYRKHNNISIIKQN